MNKIKNLLKRMRKQKKNILIQNISQQTKI
jgi:hypothetical protein